MNLINKCIENAKQRIANPKNKMNAFSYISYFCRRNNLSFDDEFFIREKISNYLNNFIIVDFTINNKKINLKG